MDNLERRQYAMMLAVLKFETTYAIDLADDVFARECFTRLRAATATLEQFAQTKYSGKNAAREGRTVKSARREALMDDLRAINRTARALARRLPGVNEKFKLPYGASDLVFLSAARAVVADAEPLVAEFVKYSLPTDFLDDLRADIAAFEAALNDHDTASKSVADTNRVIDQGIADGMEAVRDLDALIRNKYRRDARVLGAWETASHVERAARAATATATPAAPTGV
jgi:hypothetical protein